MPETLRFLNNLTVKLAGAEFPGLPDNSIASAVLETVHAVDEPHGMSSPCEKGAHIQEPERLGPEIIRREIGNPGIDEENVHDIYQLF